MSNVKLVRVIPVLLLALLLPIVAGCGKTGQAGNAASVVPADVAAYISVDTSSRAASGARCAIWSASSPRAKGHWTRCSTRPRTAPASRAATGSGTRSAPRSASPSSPRPGRRADRRHPHTAGRRGCFPEPHRERRCGRRGGERLAGGHREEASLDAYRKALDKARSTAPRSSRRRWTASTTTPSSTPT